MGVEQGIERGAELTGAGKAVGLGPGWFAQLWAGPIERLVERIDAGLVRGSIEAVLPDGSARVVGGRAPGFAAVVRLHSWRMLVRVATGGTVGLYQSWEAGEWDSPDPVQLFALFMDNADAMGDTARASGPWRLAARAMHWLHRNTRSGAARNIHAHYDLGNDFYAAWLGETMCYSSAIFAHLQPAPHPGALDLAQDTKIAAMIDRAAVPDGGSVLEIGCGWGALANGLARGGRVKVDAISLSDEQLAFCRSRIAPGTVIDFRRQDYRDVTGQYDAIVSVEMVEAVGREYWPEFFDCLARCLRPGGRAVLQYITIRDELFDAYAASADFIQTYIFPGGMLVRESEFRRLAAERGLGWSEPITFGLHYAETLRLWRANFDRAVEQGRLPPGFDARFVRLWRFYLMYCEGGFRGGGIDVAQVTLVKDQ